VRVAVVKFGVDNRGSDGTGCMSVLASLFGNYGHFTKITIRCSAAPPYRCTSCCNFRVKNLGQNGDKTGKCKKIRRDKTKLNEKK